MNIPIKHIHQIEMTSHCNLACKYCPSPKLKRPKLHMDERTFRNSLAWAKGFVQQNGEHELNLAGIGESTIHPEFVKFLGIARETMGPMQKLCFATNGVNMTEELAQAMKPYTPEVWVSLHRPEKAGPAIEILKRHNLVVGASADPAIAAINWAGQVKWHVSVARHQCMWVRNGKVIVLADGRVSRCSLDASGVGVIAHVDDDLSKVETSPYILCKTCDQDVGVPFN